MAALFPRHLGHLGDYVRGGLYCIATNFRPSTNIMEKSVEVRETQFLDKGRSAACGSHCFDALAPARMYIIYVALLSLFVAHGGQHIGFPDQMCL